MGFYLNVQPSYPFPLCLTFDLSPQNIVVLQAVTLAGVHSDVGRAPVRVVPQAIDYRLKRLWFERRT